MSCGVLQCNVAVGCSQPNVAAVRRNGPPGALIENAVPGVPTSATAAETPTNTARAKAAATAAKSRLISHSPSISEELQRTPRTLTTRRARWEDGRHLVREPRRRDPGVRPADLVGKAAPIMSRQRGHGAAIDPASEAASRASAPDKNRTCAHGLGSRPDLRPAAPGRRPLDSDQA